MHTRLKQDHFHRNHPYKKDAIMIRRLSAAPAKFINAHEKDSSVNIFLLIYRTHDYHLRWGALPVYSNIENLVLRARS